MPLEKSQYLGSVWKDDIFKNKIVFCTGGNGSICSAQVRALVHLGADACIVGRNVQKTEAMATDIATARIGATVLGVGAVDVRNIESLQNAIDQCVEKLGGIDFLIAGAAGNFLAPLHSLSMNAFKSVIDIDILGSFNVTKLCLPHLIASAKRNPIPSTYPSGRIIYVSATIHYTGAPMQTHVAVAKAGVDSLSVNVALEYGPLGLTSNVISPGPISNTEGMSRLTKQVAHGENPWKGIPCGRPGSIRDIADATVFLFSEAANFINGEVLVVDGGSWHVGHGLGKDFEYPDFLLSGERVVGVIGTKKSQL